MSYPNLGAKFGSQYLSHINVNLGEMFFHFRIRCEVCMIGPDGFDLFIYFICYLVPVKEWISQNVLM